MRAKIILLFCFSLFSGGCFLNPYSSDFSCPKTEGGKCVSVQSAYNESVEGSKKKKADKSLQDELNDIEKRKESKKGSADKNTVTNYQDALYAKLAGLLSDPATPMVAPPQVMRVLLFPYKGDGNKLYMPRFVYMFIDDPKWILDEKSAVAEVD